MSPSPLSPRLRRVGLWFGVFLAGWLAHLLPFLILAWFALGATSLAGVGVVALARHRRKVEARELAENIARLEAELLPGVAPTSAFRAEALSMNGGATYLAGSGDYLPPASSPAFPTFEPPKPKRKPDRLVPVMDEDYFERRYPEPDYYLDYYPLGYSASAYGFYGATSPPLHPHFGYSPHPLGYPGKRVRR